VATRRDPCGRRDRYNAVRDSNIWTLGALAANDRFFVVFAGVWTSTGTPGPHLIVVKTNATVTWATTTLNPL
jgi:hypothetical protein